LVARRASGMSQPPGWPQ